ncbi:MAG: hypothetical protein ACI9G1_004908 [Pirellulaceae bacterium]
MARRLQESTYSGNSARRDGGAIRLSDNVTIRDSTITDNHAESFGGGVQSFGGFGLGNTILANNTAASSPDGYSRFGDIATSLGHNLIGDGTGFDITATPSDQVGTTGSTIDPMLAALADNGGPTLTHSLLPGSPAIDAGRPTFVTPTTISLDTGTEFYPAAQLIDDSGFAQPPTFDTYAATQHPINAGTA